MTYLTPRILQKSILRSRLLSLALISLVVALQATAAYAQWTTNGNVTSTTNDVGIGTTSPASKLDVNGTIKATGLDLNVATSISPVILKSSTASTGQYTFHNLFEVQTTTGTVLARTVIEV
jgi:hypothetical protein